MNAHPDRQHLSFCLILRLNKTIVRFLIPPRCYNWGLLGMYMRGVLNPHPPLRLDLEIQVEIHDGS